MTENQIATKILDKAFEIHRTLGPGLLESVYERALSYELKLEEIPVRSQVPVSFFYKEIMFEDGFRIDLLVGEKVVVEIKSVEKLHPVNYSQTLTYLKLTEKKLGLLINFNVKYLKNGIHRLANGL